MTVVHKYFVEVEREEGQWTARVTNLPEVNTFAGNLLKLDRAVREAIALVNNLPVGAEKKLELEYDFSRVGELAELANQIHRDRKRIQDASQEVTNRTNAVVKELVAQGWSVRDVAGIVGTSAARVSQITHMQVQ